MPYRTIKVDILISIPLKMICDAIYTENIIVFPNEIF